MYCENCGYEMAPGDAFCANCGYGGPQQPLNSSQQPFNVAGPSANPVSPPPQKSNKIVIVAIIALVAIAAIVACVVLVLGSGSGTVEVPQVTKMTLGDAKKKLEDSGFTVGDVTYVNGTETADTVVEQSPSAGTKVEKGSRVTLKVSNEELALTGKVNAPDVTGMPQADAERTLKSSGFKVGAISTVESAEPSGTVVGQSPSGGVKVTPGEAIDLKVSKGTTVSSTVSVAVKTKTGDTLTSTINRNSQGFVLPDSYNHEYTKSEINAMGLSDAELCIARNEIYARMGFDFDNSGLQAYFDGCSWYFNGHVKPQLAAGSVADKNASLLLSIENDRGSRWVNLATN